MEILIAEDDMTSRLILSSIFKKWGFKPVVAINGQEAWNIMQSEDAPRLVILDWQMPKMSGIEVCQKIRGIETSDPPYLIVLTSKDEKEDIVKALDAGANDFISKPYDNEELRARIKVGKRMLELQSSLDEAYKALKHESLHDPLTTIFNRRAIMQSLEKEISKAKRGNNDLCIGMCDIDFFKNVNDTYGHQIGDEVLIAFTRLTSNQLRLYDHFGRYGGEEFLILGLGAKPPNHKIMFERICKHIRENKIPTSKGEISITVSIGVALYTGAQNSDSLLAEADNALYKAKADGRDRVFYA
jgi:two-component system, cell cycle response regulator